jgi:hypothetical protein
MQRKMVIIWALAIAAILISLAVLSYLFFFGESDGIMEEDFPGTGNGGSGSPATTLASGTFQGNGYEVEGTALLLEMDGKHIVRLENFKTENGPGLYVYLSADLEASDFVDLGTLKGIEGDMNYDVPAGTDVDTYNNVLIWCEPFGVLFGHAALE